MFRTLVVFITQFQTISSSMQNKQHKHHLMSVVRHEGWQKHRIRGLEVSITPYIARIRNDDDIPQPLERHAEELYPQVVPWEQSGMGRKN